MSEEAPRRSKFASRAIGCMVLLLLALIAFYAIARFALGKEYETTLVMHFQDVPENVWDQIMDHGQNPVTTTYHKSSEKLASTNGWPAWSEDIGEDVIEVRTTEMERPTHLVRTATSQVIHLTQITDFRLVIAEQGGTEVTAVHRNVVTGNSMADCMFKVVLSTGALEQGARSYWQLLGQHLGKPPTFQ